MLTLKECKQELRVTSRDLTGVGKRIVKLEKWVAQQEALAAKGKGASRVQKRKKVSAIDADVKSGLAISMPKKTRRKKVSAIDVFD